MTIEEYLKRIDEVIEKGVFKDDWQSLSTRAVPKWYKDGRFGLFIHWGVYSVAATESEWYPRLCYIPTHKSYRHRTGVYGKDFEYRNLIEKFDPKKFNAEEWVELFKKSGAKYIMPVGEHHDGVKMYKSRLNRWNMADLPQKRDFLAELHSACDKYGMGFLTSSHRAEHFWFMNGARKFCPSSEANGKEYADLYGPCAIPSSGLIGDFNKPFFSPTEDWLKDWLASSAELVDVNRPLAVYFDWWISRPAFKPYLKKFLAYYYNRGLEWGKEVCVFYKVGAVMKDCAVFDVERGQINGVAPELWQCDTAIAKNSWGYTDGNDFKTPCEVLTNLIDVVSKNGCFMLNVGPKADGTVCDEEKAVLLSVGKWLEKNGEGIYGVSPYTTFGEGKKRQNKGFRENIKYSSRDYRFTYKIGTIYVYTMTAKPRKKYFIKTLCKENLVSEIKSVEVLGYPKTEVIWKQSAMGLSISLSDTIESDLPLCFKLTID